MEEVANNVLEVEAKAFVRTFLYPSSRLGEQEHLKERDLELATACHDMLKQKVSKNDALAAILSSPSCPQYSNAGFTLLDPDVKSEEDLYTPFRTLFTFINAFYRISLANRPLPHDIDAAWPAAIDPKPGDLRDARKSTKPVRRDFFDTRKSKLKFSSRLGGDSAHLIPDLALMVHHDKDPNMNQASVHWKDVRVPFEIKRTFKSERKILPQLARYAHAMLMEQFDRKFVLTVSLSATQCRLFHWDSVGCHVTEPINIHADPILFIRCIARLAMMTPAELGYDEHFSNAGRVLSDERLTTTLIVRESPIHQYLDTEPSSGERPSFLSESREMHRYTRVWRGKEVSEVNIWKAGPTRVVKQSWTEDTRPCEGYFYKLTKGVSAISSLALMEECDHTWAYHNRVSEQDVIGYLKATEKKPDQQPRRGPVAVEADDVSVFGPNPRRRAKNQQRKSSTLLEAGSKRVDLLERVLLRFVFEEEHRPLIEAKGSVEVLEATAQWIEGLIALDWLGIVHRDISYNNLMLPAKRQDSVTANSQTAKIIDFGLARLKEVQKGDEPSSLSLFLTSIPGTSTDRQEPSLEGGVPASRGDPFTANARVPRARRHITGTPPFIALELIQQLERPPDTTPIEHTLQHDPMDLMAARLRGLTSSDIGFVATTRSDILGNRRETLVEMDGPFWALGDFVLDFANYHHGCSRIKESIDAVRVRDMAIKHRNILIRRMEEHSASRMVEVPPPKIPQKPLATVDSPKHKFAALGYSLETGEGEML
ncbi:hypothetical protein FS837_001346 [Tulasnella sp. UAMH 9824]|nr:hypothetical protein FS837_001346 [Tulasnella sp. UAMH 9824]